MIDITQPTSKGFARDIETFWNGLTGQSGENQRTQQTNEANLQAVQETNATNKQIADENLQYQRELQEYNKGLQQQIFDREDTAYQRTKNDMLAAGLNPLSMQGTNGAGEVISQTPLNNQFHAQTPQFQKANTLNAPIQALSYMGNISSMVNQILTSSLERDQLRLQNQRSNLENWVYAEKNGIEFPFDKNINKDFSFKKRNNTALPKWFTDDNNNWEGNNYYSYPRQEAYAEFLKNYGDERTLAHDIEIGRYPDDTEIEKAVTSILDWLTTGRTEEQFNRLVNKYPFLKLFMDWNKNNKE